MAKFHGEVGYVPDPIETSPGVYENVAEERVYFGDIINNIRRLEQGEGVNDNLVLTNSISIMADAYANEHIFAIRYVRWEGVLWRVNTVEVRRPRLILRLGGVYNGPTAS